MSIYGVISGPCLPAFGLNTERYEVSLRIQSKCGKIQTRNYSVFGQFSRSGINAVLVKLDLVFKDETVHEAYSTYSNFICFNKNDDMSMTVTYLSWDHQFSTYAKFSEILTFLTP